MRLWSLHPKYLDRLGLVALWREALLAQAVLYGETRGYRNHPQLERFQDHETPFSAISLYLAAIHLEASRRGYCFNIRKIRPAEGSEFLAVSTGQLEYEWKHLLKKLEKRNPPHYHRWSTIQRPVPHPLFKTYIGDIERWERR